VPRALAACALFLTDPAPTDTYTLSLHDALPIFPSPRRGRQRTAGRLHASLALYAGCSRCRPTGSCRCIGDSGRLAHLGGAEPPRSEEHTSELQSRENLVCRLLLEKKKKQIMTKC